MPSERFFYDGNLRGTITLDAIEGKHLSRVMRKTAGDAVEVINGRGDLAEATLIKGSELSITSSIHAAPTPPLTLIQALIKPNRLDIIIEKGTELGATAFWFFPSRRSEKTTLSNQQISRLRSIAISAMKQSGRLHLPEIALKTPDEIFHPHPGTSFYGVPGESAPTINHTTQAPYYIYIGPEGGFDPKEIGLLETTVQAEPFSMGPFTLRAETAAIASIGILSEKLYFSS